VYESLLVPLDGSGLAEVVLPLVRRLALAWQAKVILLHVIERGSPTEVHGDRHLSEVAEAEEYLSGIAERLRVDGIEVEVHAHPSPEGDVARSIVQHSEEVRCDLVVLCTHGQGRMRNLLFGRIAQQVLRRGTAPVLLVRPPEADAELPEHGVVLVPVGGPAGSDRVLLPALSFSRALHATLRLVTIVPTQETLRGNRQAVGTLLPATTRAALDLEESEAQAHLDALRESVQASGDGVPVETEVCRGDVPGLLAAEATKPDVVLTAITTHARPGIQTVWSGSVTSQLLSRMRAPILLVRPDGQAAADAGE
jgi:nucleotide-binding universal stress UspA family protein